jgi:positive regulator of sigma E activity
MDLTDSDRRVYAVSGAFAVVVYLVALAVLVLATDIDLTVRTTATLTGGFLLFMGSYVVAMLVYRNVRSREDAN